MDSKTNLNYEKILLQDSLFTEYPLYNVDKNSILNLLFHLERNGRYNQLKIIDSYCTICKKETTFNSEFSSKEEISLLNDILNSPKIRFETPENSHTELIKELEKNCTFVRKFNCPRKPNDSAHSQIFVFRIIGTTLIKVGQHPPLAELLSENLKKYKKLGEQIYSELNRAVGLSTHGVGIGAFVYLRRIIEKHIVNPEIERLIKNGITTKEQVSKLDFKGKINLSKDGLPNFLVENPKIYSVLSKGIHELEEEESKQFFPILKSAIEIVLDEHIEINERQKKNKTIANQLNKL
ncbi:hypothetical protein K1F50_01490 [Muricauda oceani]|uniref:Uncharacterized protein n=1 Tax=Flagellimonas oceani TaxID=2698672 RepID=A0A6G7J1L4_9FLAO|nr:hypothetical protein [Allomuricauda oceani]MBW8241454.1 hypothetical protein [Allomuricauda oceani]QII44550.1 hypothetical protein GVT53_07620 [Allomuricauda oceani]